MKRLVTILVIFSVMMGFAIFEIVYASKFYTEQHRLLKHVEVCFDADPENIDNLITVQAFEKAENHWKSRKRIVMMIGNHNVAKFLDEKMVSVKELIRLNQQYDAYVNLNVAIIYVEQLKEDLMPKLHNLL